VISDLPAHASSNSIAAPKAPADRGLDPIATRAAVRGPRRVCRQADGRTVLERFDISLAESRGLRLWLGQIESRRQRRDRA
jgi:hypothetical protein